MNAKDFHFRPGKRADTWRVHGLCDSCGVTTGNTFSGDEAKLRKQLAVAPWVCPICAKQKKES